MIGAATALGEFVGQLSPRLTQYLTSAVLTVAFLAVGYALYVSGPALKRRLNDDAAEAVQVATFTAISVLAGVALVGIWNATTEVQGALADIRPSPEAGVKVLITALAFAVAYTATRFTKRLVRVGDSRDAITNHQREVLHHVVQIAVFLPAIIFAFALWTVPAQDLLLSASVLGVVLGLAARQTLGSMLAGFVLLFSRPFEVGDWVVIEDREGVVTDVSIVNTRIRTFDDETVVFPNDQITESPVVNRSRSNRLRLQADVGIDYETDVGRAAEVAAAAMDEVDVLMNGPDSDVVVDRFGDSAVVLTLRFWISNPTVQRKWTARNAVMEAVKEAFEREGISIPYPQRVLMGREEAGGLRVSTDSAGEAGDESDAVDESASDGEGGAESERESSVEAATNGGDGADAAGRNAEHADDGSDSDRSDSNRSDRDGTGG